jgi:hypothetical protein
MNFIKRYKARRATRKEIEATNKAIVSARIKKGAAQTYEDWFMWNEVEYNHYNNLSILKQELCKL